MYRYNGLAVGQIMHRGQIRHDAPVLCTDFHSDQQTIFSGGADGTVRQWNVTQGTQTQTIGKHDQPVKCCKWLPELNCVATASWDKTVRVWDCRTPTPALTIQLNEKIHAMDTKNKILVLATADQHIHCYPDMTNTNNKFEYKSPLGSYQTRCISIFNDVQGFALGSVEGRVAIEYFSSLPNKPKLHSQQTKNSVPENKNDFVFKCHRDNTDIYSVNAIDFHCTNKFLTAGSDGQIVWWDKDKRNRVAIRDFFKRKNINDENSVPTPIVSAKFSPNGTTMFYAATYDWSKGADYAPKVQQNLILAHNIDPAEIATKKT